MKEREGRGRSRGRAQLLTHCLTFSNLFVLRAAAVTRAQCGPVPQRGTGGEPGPSGAGRAGGTGGQRPGRVHVSRAACLLSLRPRGASWGLSSYRGPVGRRGRQWRLQLPECFCGCWWRHRPIEAPQGDDWCEERYNPLCRRVKTCPPSGRSPDRQASQPIESGCELSNVAASHSAPEQCLWGAGPTERTGRGGQPRGAR